MFDYIAVRCFIPHTALSNFFLYDYFSCFTKQFLLLKEKKQMFLFFPPLNLQIKFL